MSRQNLATYLNDHLAGSVVALELLGHLELVHSGKPLANYLAGLHADILADRKQLEAVMAQLKVPASAPRKAAAWLAEKLSELKLVLDAPSIGPLRLLEGLEALSVGIEGKRLLWLALQAAGTPGLEKPDYHVLVRRAEDQRERVESLRAEAARAALLLLDVEGPQLR